jgi:NADPH:quinone reductase-like Zn-dependent oxidoreductase
VKALAFNEFGGPEQLALRDVPDPKRGEADVLIRVRACALNHVDLFVREGLPALRTPLPFWTGCDIAGDIVDVGSEARGVAVGDRVVVNPGLSCGHCEFCVRGDDCLCLSYRLIGEHVPGGMAEIVAVPAANVLKLPDHVTYEDGAAFVLVNMTAWRMVVTQARVRPGEDVLILGVGGGVSSTAVQIAKLCGARVIVTSSADDKLQRARGLGADVTINYAKQDWARTVRDLTRHRGVDVIVENVGAATWKQSLRSLCKGGRLVTCGATTGPIGETDIRVLFWNQLHLIGSTMATRKEFHDVMRLFFAGRLRAIVDEVAPLAEGAAAQRRLAEGKQFGKIVLRVSSRGRRGPLDIKTRRERAARRRRTCAGRWACRGGRHRHPAPGRRG